MSRTYIVYYKSFDLARIIFPFLPCFMRFFRDFSKFSKLVLPPLRQEHYMYTLSALSIKKHAVPGGTACSISVCGDYASISETTPAPTVRPPSRIAKRRPGSIAIGVISATSILTLSPGMHISVPSGKLITPVTSVVRK